MFSVAILIEYGYLLVFAWMFLGQVGVPLPAIPVLLAAGVLSETEHLNLPAVLAAGTLACVAADILWFVMGRRYGDTVLRLLCRLSLDPNDCAERTTRIFNRSQATTLLVAKFVPGLSTVASPIAGQAGMNFWRFLVFDTAGSAIWVGSYVLSGWLFGFWINRDPHLLDWAGRYGGALLILAVLAFLQFRVFRGQRSKKDLSAEANSPESKARIKSPDLFGLGRSAILGAAAGALIGRTLGGPVAIVVWGSVGAILSTLTSDSGQELIQTLRNSFGRIEGH